LAQGLVLGRTSDTAAHRVGPRSVAMATGLNVLALVSFVCVCNAVGEGEDLRMELADEVLSNKQALLSIPWEIYRDTPSFRDVGYVGEFPISDSAATEIHLSSLQTGREIQGFPPNVLIGRALVKDSLKVTQPPSSFRFSGNGGEEIKHLNGLTNPVGDLTVWQWQRMRWSAAKEWLEYWADRGIGGSERLAIIHSSGDVLYGGGCDENTIVYKYNRIVNASGGSQKIVMAAELSPWPADLGWSYNMTSSSWVEGRRADVLSDLSVPDDWESTYANCTDPSLGPCNSSPKYMYANSGFMMGTIDALIDMIADLGTTYSGWDNRWFNEYYLKNPATVTLDYAGDLSMSLHNMNLGSLPLEVNTTITGKNIQSKLTNRTICFLHGNGNSFATLQGLAGEMKA